MLHTQESVGFFCKANSCFIPQVFLQGLSGVRRAGTDLSSAGGWGWPHPQGMQQDYSNDASLEQPRAPHRPSASTTKQSPW